MNRWKSLSWVILFWVVGAPLFFGGPWIGMLWAGPGSPLVRDLWIVGLPALGFAMMALALFRLVSAAQRSKTNVFATRWMRGYYLEVGVATLILTAACLLPLVTPPPSTPLARQLVALTPIPGVVLVALAVSRWVMSGDEYWRKTALENLGGAAATTAAWTMSYGILEHVGLPKLSMFWVWPSMLLAWGVWSGLRRVLAR